MDPYRLEEIDDVWSRFVDQAWGDVAPPDAPYRLTALLVVAKRALATEREIRSYSATHEWAGDLAELRAVQRRLANIRHAARAAHGALAASVNRYVPPWPPAGAHGSASDWGESPWLELRGWSADSALRTDEPGSHPATERGETTLNRGGREGL